LLLLKNFFVSDSGVAVFEIDGAAFGESAFFEKFLHGDIGFVGVDADRRDLFDFADLIGKTHEGGAHSHSVPVGVDSEAVDNEIFFAVGEPCAVYLFIGGFGFAKEGAETDEDFAHIHYVKGFFVDVGSEDFAGRIIADPLIDVVRFKIFVFDAAYAAENRGNIGF